MIDLDVFTPSDDRAVRLVVGKSADQSTAAGMDRRFSPALESTAGARGGIADASDMPSEPAGTQAPPVDTPPKPNNDDYRRIQVIGSIR